MTFRNIPFCKQFLSEFVDVVDCVSDEVDTVSFDEAVVSNEFLEDDVDPFSSNLAVAKTATNISTNAKTNLSVGFPTKTRYTVIKETLLLSGKNFNKLSLIHSYFAVVMNTTIRWDIGCAQSAD